jgi:hypothetical protein
VPVDDTTAALEGTETSERLTFMGGFRENDVFPSPLHGHSKFGHNRRLQIYLLSAAKTFQAVFNDR